MVRLLHRIACVKIAISQKLASKPALDSYEKRFLARFYTFAIAL
ncbi:18874_t:CDS:2, partial [Gigaspora margarita]